VFQAGLCIYPETQHYSFSHYHCCSILYLLDTIRTNLSSCSAFQTVFIRGISTGADSLRELCFAIQMRFPCLSTVNFTLNVILMWVTPVVFATNKNAVSAKYNLNVRYIHERLYNSFLLRIFILNTVFYYFTSNVINTRLHLPKAYTDEQLHILKSTILLFQIYTYS